MVVVALPDIIAAVTAHLRDEALVTALTSTRISARWQKSWNPAAGHRPEPCLIARAAGLVPALAIPELNIAGTRIDLRCYGGSDNEAMNVWRVVKPTLVPGQAARQSWTRGGCRVYGIDLESGPNTSVEPDTDWPIVLGSVAVQWCEIPSIYNSES